jgi:hypothetical protein
VIWVSSLKSFSYLVALEEAVQSFKVNKVENKTSTIKPLALSLWLVDVLFLIAKMIHHLPLLNATARHRIISDIALLVLPQSPFFTPITKTGTPFQYEMTNCGELGWVSDTQGYDLTLKLDNLATFSFQKLVANFSCQFFLIRYRILSARATSSTSGAIFLDINQISSEVFKI